MEKAVQDNPSYYQEGNGSPTSSRDKPFRVQDEAKLNALLHEHDEAIWVSYAGGPAHYIPEEDRSGLRLIHKEQLLKDL